MAEGKTGKIRAILWELLFPKFCLHCGKLNYYLCPEGRSALKFLRRQTCPVCHRIRINGQTCRQCRKMSALSGLISAGSYSHPLLRKLIKTYKYQFVQEIYRDLSGFLIRFLHHSLNEFKVLLPNFKFFLNKRAILVPVPLHPSKLRLRGFNQSELIARELSREFGWPLCPGLRKTRNTKAQTKLKASRRLNNQDGVFLWGGENIYKRDIILVDDVFTTGATLESAARTLKTAGAGSIWAITLAKGK